ncbi:MAG: hypothetical protein Q8O37_05400 [Sulfuricellaceae bacterium]|nr:hypothetical protein [Sulfuricellaceae bacterium]
MLAELRRSASGAKDKEQEQVTQLQKQLKQTEERLNRIYEAVETGTLPLDETLQKRVDQLKSTRESIMIEMAGVRRSAAIPIERILPSQVDAFSKFIRAKLMDKDSALAKSYLQAVVDEIIVEGDEATIKGSYAQRQLREPDGGDGQQ